MQPYLLEISKARISFFRVSKFLTLQSLAIFRATCGAGPRVQGYRLCDVTIKMSAVEEEEDRSEEVWAPHVAEYGYYSALKSGSIDGTDNLPHDHAIVRALNSNCKLIEFHTYHQCDVMIIYRSA